MKDVYLVHAKGTDFYKIGLSQNAENRLSSLQTSSPYQLELIARGRYAEAREVESTLHDLFDYHRVQGEWFEIEDDIGVSYAKGMVKYGLAENFVHEYSQLVDRYVDLIDNGLLRAWMRASMFFFYGAMDGDNNVDELCEAVKNCGNMTNHGLDRIIGSLSDSDRVVQRE